MIQIYVDSGLYEMVEGKYTKLTDSYSDGDSLVDHFDVPITHYYETDQRAISDNKLETYNERKLASEYFEMVDGEIVAKKVVDQDGLKSFFVSEYNKALNYLFDDPQIIKANNIVVNTVGLAMLVCTLISSIAFYLIVPLADIVLPADSRC